MPEIQERPMARRITGGDTPSYETAYVIVGTDDEAAAMALVLSTTPLTWGNAPRLVPELEQVGDVIYYATVRWSFSQAPTSTEEGQEGLSFSTKGGKRKLTVSRGTTSYAPSGETPPDFQGAIGVTSNGVEGVEITAPALSFVKTRRFEASWLTADRIKALARLSGTINSAPIFGFAPGELLFMGAEGNQKNPDEDVDVSFEFVGSENATGLAVGEITAIAKDGWQYLWTLFATEEDTSADALVQRPKAVYVEDVYPAADFDSLGLT